MNYIPALVVPVMYDTWPSGLDQKPWNTSNFQKVANLKSLK